MNNRMKKFGLRFGIELKVRNGQSRAGGKMFGRGFGIELKVGSIFDES